MTTYITKLTDMYLRSFNNSYLSQSDPALLNHRENILKAVFYGNIHKSDIDEFMNKLTDEQKQNISEYTINVYHQSNY